ncbi:hypothetical protein [Acinetobacter phage vB_AbaM_fThrA]|nr:hypothetical protein [Acinetobacter phage vB_AbaM_fThrA]
MNLLDATITKIIDIEEKNGFWYVIFEYNVYGAIKEDCRRFKYREDAEKLTVGTIISV